MINFYNFLQLLKESDWSYQDEMKAYDNGTDNSAEDRMTPQKWETLSPKQKNIELANSLITNGYSFSKKLGELILTAYGPGAVHNPDETVEKLWNAFPNEHRVAYEAILY